jgi:hypothetical protein
VRGVARPDKKSHQASASGLGEVNLIATWWLGPTGLQPRGNLALGLGLKAPSGRHDVEDSFWNGNGTMVQFPVDQSIQPGDGGWGIIVEAQAFEPIWSRIYGYAVGSYTADPRKITEVVRTPGSTQHWGVPDTWNARAGMAMTLWPEWGLTASLGGRLDGTTKRDLIGGGAHLGSRRPAVAGYIDPSVSLTLGSRTFALNVPVRAYKNFRPSYQDVETAKVGGGGLARYLILASFSQRFLGATVNVRPERLEPRLVR